MGKSREDGEYTHKYTGPNTKWGLNTGTSVKIVCKKSGGKLVKKHGSKIIFLVGVGHLEKL